tara:strand:+ start:367 stop:636 length:270 start_codon:yes stop_codon:yes gene_type:complete
VFVTPFFLLIAVVWLTFTVIQMNKSIKALTKMTALRLALEVNRAPTIGVTKLDEYVAKYSEAALQKASSQGDESSNRRNLFLDWFQRLF